MLDTSSFSDLVAGRSYTDTWLAGLAPGDRLAICTIVKGELLFGIERLPAGKRRDVLAAKVNNLLTAFACEAVPDTAAVHYAAIKQARRRKGLSLDENDLWIASTTAAFNAVLVTRDADFRGIDGLMIADWSAPEEAV